MNKFVISLRSLTLVCILLVCSCSNAGYGNIKSSAQAPPASAIISSAYDSYDNDQSWDSSKISFITLEGKSIVLKGGGAVIDGNKIAITSAGTYFISGTLDDGQIVVKAEDNAIVKLVLHGVDITSSTTSPIYVYNAGKTVITLAEGTANYITDRDNYVFADSTEDEPNAAVFSKDDLTINGRGSLIVNANYNHGIQCKDDLKMTGGTIVVNAPNDGIKGRDSVSIRNARVTVNSGGDGIQSSNQEDTDKGNIIIESGMLDITCKKDGIQAASMVIINEGNIRVVSGGGSASGSISASKDIPPGFNHRQAPGANSSSSTVSAKGIKAGSNVTITGGIVNLDSSDDSINTNGNITVSGANIHLSSGDDGVHADTSLDISGGDINIVKCYEGLESSAITLTGGTIYITSSDDGINITGGNEGPGLGDNFQPTAFPGGTAGQQQMGFPPGNENSAGPIGPPWVSDNLTRPIGPPWISDNLTRPLGPPPGQVEDTQPTMDPIGQEESISTGNPSLNIKGVYLVINAGGDGIDVSGKINMTGGTVIVNGPTNNSNGALDHGGFVMTGGILIAAGSSGMAMAPGTSSAQYSVMVNLTSSQPAGTMFHIRSDDGKEILTFMPVKSYQSVVFSSPELKNGVSYTIYTGGSSSGTGTDGIYSNGVYTPGTEVFGFTISDIVTTAGTSFIGFPGGGGNMAPPGGASDNMAHRGGLPRPGGLSDNTTRSGGIRH